MRSVTSLLGILLIILGIASLGYQGFTYTKQEKIAQIGSVQITADSQKTVYLSPLLGGLSLVAGVVLVLIGRRGGN